jgi:DNA-binding NtrC family response regulator
MDRVRSLVATVAQSTAPVLIRGDTGTGKELVARHIHALSPRRKGRFFAVNCAALTESLFESEMFGHERGAFTGATSQKAGMCELANDGTLLLDEIGELAPLSQAKLLRFLQSGEFIRVGGQSVQRSEARILAATNAPLEQMIQDGRFRPDLFYRLNVLELRLPSLQEHREDLPELISHLMVQAAHKHGRPSLRLAPRAFERLLGHTWTGNVRELQGVLERSVLMAQGQVVDDVQLGQPSTPDDEGTPFAVDVDRPLREVIDSATRLVERNYLVRVLAASGGHVIAASKRANIDRRNLYRKLRDYGIDPDTFRRGRGSKR